MSVSQSIMMYLLYHCCTKFNGARTWVTCWLKPLFAACQKFAMVKASQWPPRNTTFTFFHQSNMSQKKKSASNSSFSKPINNKAFWRYFQIHADNSRNLGLKIIWDKFYHLETSANLLYKLIRDWNICNICTKNLYK